MQQEETFKIGDIVQVKPKGSYTLSEEWANVPQFPPGTLIKIEALGNDPEIVHGTILDNAVDSQKTDHEEGSIHPFPVCSLSLCA